MKHNKFLKALIGLALFSMPIAACGGSSSGGNNSSGGGVTPTPTPTPTPGPVDKNTWREFFDEDAPFINDQNSLSATTTATTYAKAPAFAAGSAAGNVKTNRIDYEKGKIAFYDGATVMQYGVIDFDKENNGVLPFTYYDTNGNSIGSIYMVRLTMAMNIGVYPFENFDAFTYDTTKQSYYCASYPLTLYGETLNLKDVRVAFANSKLSAISFDLLDYGSMSSTYSGWGTTIVNIPGHVNPDPENGPIDQATWDYYLTDFSFINEKNSFTANCALTTSYGGDTLKVEYDQGKLAFYDKGEVYQYGKIDFSSEEGGSFRIDFFNLEGNKVTSQYMSREDMANNLLLYRIPYSNFSYDSVSKVYVCSSYTMTIGGATITLRNIKVGFADGKLSSVYLDLAGSGITGNINSTFTEWGKTSVIIPEGGDDPTPIPSDFGKEITSDEFVEFAVKVGSAGYRSATVYYQQEMQMSGMGNGSGGSARFSSSGIRTDWSYYDGFEDAINPGIFHLTNDAYRMLSLAEESEEFDASKLSYYKTTSGEAFYTLVYNDSSIGTYAYMMFDSYGDVVKGDCKIKQEEVTINASIEISYSYEILEGGPEPSQYSKEILSCGQDTAIHHVGANHWEPDGSNIMQAASVYDVSLVDEDIADYLQDNLSNIKYLYMIEGLEIGNEQTGWSTPALIDGQVVTLDGAFALKALRAYYDRNESIYTFEQWMPDPRTSHMYNLTPESFFIPNWSENSDEYGFHWGYNPTVIDGAGTYTFIVAEFYSKASEYSYSGAMGVIKTSEGPNPVTNPWEEDYNSFQQAAEKFCSRECPYVAASVEYYLFDNSESGVIRYNTPEGYYGNNWYAIDSDPYHFSDFLDLYAIYVSMPDPDYVKDCVISVTSTYISIRNIYPDGTYEYAGFNEYGRLIRYYTNSIDITISYFETRFEETPSTNEEYELFHQAALEAAERDCEYVGAEVIYNMFGETGTTYFNTPEGVYASDWYLASGENQYSFDDLLEETADTFTEETIGSSMSVAFGVYPSYLSISFEQDSVTGYIEFDSYGHITYYDVNIEGATQINIRINYSYERFEEQEPTSWEEDYALFHETATEFAQRNCEYVGAEVDYNMCGETGTTYFNTPEGVYASEWYLASGENQYSFENLLNLTAEEFTSDILEGTSSVSFGVYSDWLSVGFVRSGIQYYVEFDYYGHVMYYSQISDGDLFFEVNVSYYFERFEETSNVNYTSELEELRVAAEDFCSRECTYVSAELDFSINEQSGIIYYNTPEDMYASGWFYAGGDETFQYSYTYLLNYTALDVYEILVNVTNNGTNGAVVSVDVYDDSVSAVVCFEDGRILCYECDSFGRVTYYLSSSGSSTVSVHINYSYYRY